KKRTCSGIRCKTNSDCGVNEKCQVSPCGPRICTAEQTLTCANMLCNINTTCRDVTTCNTCPMEPRCIPVGQIYDGIDNECRRLSYTEVVLVEKPSNKSTYKQLICCQSCPSGATCAGGLCCRGKVSVPLTKSGLCPTNQVAGSECKGTGCSNDYDCPGEQKCCSLCRKVCTDPIFVLNKDLCSGTQCQKGEVCALRTQFCPKGRACPQALLAVCVPYQCANCTLDEQCISIAKGYSCSRTDLCGGCPSGSVCRPTGIQCVTVPCPQYSCVPIDRCGGCRQGQVCKRNTCSTKLCASYKCYPSSP
ncbi:unnamed protein product, partial [Candidula unifasciata]